MPDMDVKALKDELKKLDTLYYFCEQSIRPCRDLGMSEYWVEHFRPFRLMIKGRMNEIQSILGQR